jgi:hypothetical protein
MTLFTSKFRKTAFLAVALSVSQTIMLTPQMTLAADNSVRLAGQVVFTNKAAAGGMSVDERASAIQRNLDNALVASKDRSPASVNIVYVKGVPVITLGGYQVATVDAENAKAAGTTPALLAKRWADALRQILVDRDSVDAYTAQLNGSYQSNAPQQANASPGSSYTPQANNYQNYNPTQNVNYDQYNRNTTGYPVQGGYAGQGQSAYPVQRGRVVYAPAGLMLPINLNTAISTQVAQPGDLIQASLTQNVNLGDSAIPAGSTLIGQITEAKSGGFLGRSGMLGIKFNRLRTPDGMETPITAHIVGGIGKYTDVGGDQSDVVKGETWKTKAGQAALRGAIGAGTGAALGTAVGAIAGGGRGVGRGAWSGTAIGGGVGLAQSLLLRKGRDVTIPSGTSMQVQLDAPVSISGGGMPPYTGAF